MRVFIDGLSPLAYAVTRKLIDNHRINKKNILVNTYDRGDTADYRRWLNLQHIDWFIRDYRDSSTIKLIQEFRPDIILSAYGLRIIPRSILELGQWAINMHPSYLPDYKGRWICPWAIINGETHHGITFHSMTDIIDVGDILWQKKVLISVDETAWSLYNKLMAKFVQEFDEFFTALKEYRLDPIPMPPGGRYFSKAVPFDGRIDPTWDIAQIEKFIRAMFFPPHPGAIVNINGVDHECTSLEIYKKLVTKI